MTTATNDYVMGRTAAEYDRLRAQARVWEASTAGLLDRIGLGAGSRCLDVGCGPGETMRLMAERVGPQGRVTGVDTDAELGRAAVAGLHAAGHAQCDFVAADAEHTDVLPTGGYDLVYGRLILLHAGDPAALVRRMWEWVAPGGHLVIQDYVLTAVDADPPSPLIDEWRRVFLQAYEGADRDVRLGLRLPRLFAENGPGWPDGVEVVGRLERFEDGLGAIAATYRSVSPVAIRLGLITEEDRDEWLAEAGRQAAGGAGPRSAMWPLMAGVHRRRDG